MTSSYDSLVLISRMFTIYLVQIATVASIVYLVLGPLVSYFRDHKGFRRFPNLSKFAGVTNIPYMVATFYGNRYEKVNHAHIVKKQPIVRVGPNHISFGSVEAIKDVYGHQTKTTKISTRYLLVSTGILQMCKIEEKCCLLHSRTEMSYIGSPF